MGREKERQRERESVRGMKPRRTKGAFGNARSRFAHPAADADAADDGSVSVSATECVTDLDMLNVVTL